MTVRLLAFTGLVIVVAWDDVSAQLPAVSFSGGINLSNEFYSSSGIPARRSPNTSRIYFTPTITLFDQVRIPMEFSFSTREPDYRQAYNRFGINPELFGWLTLHGGDFTAQISDLTFGDTQIRGGGVEMRPGLLRFSFLYGKTQDALAPDTANGVRGAYKRTVLAAKLGVGSDDGFYVDLNFLHAADDSTSLVNPSLDLAPVENSVVSVGFGIPLFEELVKLRGEAAVAGFSNDIRSPKLDNAPGFVKPFFTPRTSSQVDGAATCSVIITPTNAFTVGLNAKWIGPGYVTLGFLQMPNDVLDLTLAPSVRFDDNRISLRGSIGVRFNNLRSDRLSTTRQTLGSFGADAQLTEAFGFDLQYSNYGMRSNPRNDTLRLDNIAQQLSVTPHLTFESFGGMSTAAVSYSYQDFTDKNIITSSTNQYRTQSLTALWTVAFPSSLSFSTTYTFVSSKTVILTTRIHSVNETVGYQFFDRTLTVSGTVGYNNVNTIGTASQVGGGLSLSYRSGHWGTLTASLTTNQYDYGDPAAGASYHELYGSLKYTYAF